MNDWNEEDWKRFEDALRDREPWELAAELELPPPDAGALRELAARLDEERSVAEELLEPLLVSMAAFQEAQVERDPAFAKRGVVDVLNDAAGTLRKTQPQFALVTAGAAVTIAASLAREGACPGRIVGRTHIEHAWALFLVGHYRDAEEALRSAEAAFDDDPRATDWDRAHGSLVRANLLVETHRLDEASAEAARAAAAFSAFGDSRYFLIASLIEGGILFMRRDYRSAAEVLDRIAEEAARVGDRLHVARARQTAGNCYIDLGEYDRAAAYFLEALAVWDELGLETERVRTNWSIGVLKKATGDLEEAIERIDDARRTFEALGVVNDAAIARLDLAEVLLLAGRPDEVPGLLRNVVVSFTSEGIVHNAKIALAYLREAVEAGAIEPRIIRHVRDYLDELPTHPTSPFAPLP
ncbi:MAG TPA: tetratricopeptide repeat protein [Thermoanaerobaculia bacterium]|nr:tetratricopeptide repeat protein [Thermoanaerobaculia bacterium]